MGGYITYVQREAVLNSGNINQLQLDVQHNQQDNSNLMAEINQLTINVYQLEAKLKYIEQHLNL